MWNEVEKIEKSSKVQLSREVEVAIPKELSLEEKILMLKDYVKENFVDNGICADIAVHDKKDGNPHAHIMLTMQPIKEIQAMERFLLEVKKSENTKLK